MNKMKPQLKAYWCCFDNEEWGAFVIASGRGQAKAIFLSSYKWEGEWNDIRCYKQKDVPGDLPIAPCILDVPNSPLLKLLGLEYDESEEDYE